ncbi:cyclic nucleotide-binding/CBS domain-containing protein [Bacteroidota bacterium]
MKTGIKIVDAMTNKPIIASTDLTSTECAKLMRKYNVGSVLVKEGKDIIGIITEQDLVNKVLAKAKNPDDLTARDIMEKNLITISPDKDIYDAMIEMRNNDIRKLPVQENGRIVGFLTMKDIVKIEPQLFDLMIENISIREEKNKPILAAGKSEEGMCESCGNFSYRLKDDAGIKLCPNCRTN